MRPKSLFVGLLITCSILALVWFMMPCDCTKIRTAYDNKTFQELSDHDGFIILSDVSIVDFASLPIPPTINWLSFRRCVVFSKQSIEAIIAAPKPIVQIDFSEMQSIPEDVVTMIPHAYGTRKVRFEKITVLSLDSVRSICQSGRIPSLVIDGCGGITANEVEELVRQFPQISISYFPPLDKK